MIQHEKEKAGDKLQVIYKECVDNNQKLKEETEKLKIINRECNDKYVTVYRDMEKLQIRLAECEKKTITSKPPVSKQINVVINYDSQVPDTTVDKLEKLLGRSKIKISVSRVKMKQRLKPVIMYFNADDIKVADYISTIINNPSYFRTGLKYSSYFNSNMDKTAGDIVIMLTNIY